MVPMRTVRYEKRHSSILSISKDEFGTADARITSPFSQTALRIIKFAMAWLSRHYELFPEMPDRNAILIHSRKMTARLQAANASDYTIFSTTGQFRVITRTSFDDRIEH